MDSDASSIGSKSRGAAFSVISSSERRQWNETENRMVVRAVETMIDTMAYRGFVRGRIVSIERMNSYVKEKFGITQESQQRNYFVGDERRPWLPIYEVMDQVKLWFLNEDVQLSLTTLDYVPVIEIEGSDVPATYTYELLSRRHDSRMETTLIDAMSPDWGDKSWYTTPASAYAKEHGHKGCLGIVLRTPYARSYRATVGKNELYNLHGLAQSFGYTSLVYLSFEPLTSYSQRVIEQKYIATNVQFFPIEQSQCNILRHVMVPYYRMMTEEGVRAVEARHSKERAFFPRVSKSDPVVKWMQFPPHSVLLEVPHLGTGYDGSRFCYVLAVKETEDDEEMEDEEAAEASGAGAYERK